MKPAGSYEAGDNKAMMKNRAHMIATFIGLHAKTAAQVGALPTAGGPFGAAKPAGATDAEEANTLALARKVKGLGAAAVRVAAAANAATSTVVGLADTEGHVNTPFLNMASNDGLGLVQMVEETAGGVQHPAGAMTVRNAAAARVDPKTNEETEFSNGAAGHNDYIITVNNKELTSNGKDGKPQAVHSTGIVSFHLHTVIGANSHPEL